jgi:hypothetical protein
MAPSLLRALAVLRAEEDSSGAPDAGCAWQGVQELNRDALIARGLAVELVDDKGGPPRYRTTPAGRQRLAETNTHTWRLGPTWRRSRWRRSVWAVHLRAERDREEAAFTEAFSEWRSKRFAPRGGVPAEVHTANPDATFAPAIQGRLGPLQTETCPPGSRSPDTTSTGSARRSTRPGFVLVTYRTTARDNPRPVKLANGIETKAFVPGPLAVFLTPSGTEVIFSIELQRHDGHQVVSSNWVKGSVESIAQPDQRRCGGSDRPRAAKHSTLAAASCTRPMWPQSAPRQAARAGSCSGGGGH